MKFRSLLTTGVLVLAGAAVGVTPAAAAPGPVAAVPAAAPTASVHPSHGLTSTSTVTLAAAGLPASTEVNIVQCDQPSYDNGDFVSGCSPRGTITTSAAGAFSVQYNPRDPVYRNLEYGDPIPVYCRADVCRFYVEWVDGGELHSVPTNLMYFTGDPATIAASPASGLTDGQQVTVTGTARRSTGRYVTVVQASCFQLVQGSGCVGNLPLATVPLKPNGTFTVKVPVYRYLSDGSDCVDFWTGCQLHVVVLGADGRPDDSFGVSSIGQPGVDLFFTP